MWIYLLEVRSHGGTWTATLAARTTQAILTLNNYLLQHEKNVPDVVHALQKIKDEVEFNLGTKKKQMTLDNFVKELN